MNSVCEQKYLQDIYTVYDKNTLAYLYINMVTLFSNFEMITFYNCKQAKIQCCPRGESREVCYSFITTILFPRWSLKSMAFYIHTCPPTTYFYSTQDTLLLMTVCQVLCSYFKIQVQGSHSDPTGLLPSAVFSLAAQLDHFLPQAGGQCQVCHHSFSHFFVPPFSIPEL